MERHEELRLTSMAREGDAEAFSALLEELRPLAYAVALRLVGPQDAEDVVMDAYVKAWQALPGFSGRSSLKTWLYRITWNCATDALRRRARLREMPFPTGSDGEPLEPAAPDTAATAADEVSGRDLAERLGACLAHLPDAQRTTLLLRFADGLSYKEIAAATGVSIGTVMSRLFNGRRRLRALLDLAEREGGGRRQEGKP